MITLNLKRIQTFVAIAELGSFRLAGEHLHRSPSAVSAHIAQLEAELKVPLFNRTTRRVSLTDGGQMLLSRCKTVMSDLDATVRELREESQLRRGRVAIGSSPAMLCAKLPAILAEYERLYPGVLLTLKEHFAKDGYARLVAGETDFAIGPRIQGFGDLQFEPIITNPFVVVIPRKLPSPRGGRMTLQQAMAHPQISLPIETSIRQMIEQMFREAGTPFTTRYDVRQLQTMFTMVEAGLGIAIMPALSVPPPRDRAFKIARLVEPEAEQEICCVTVRGKRLSGPAETLRALIVRRLRAGARR